MSLLTWVLELNSGPVEEQISFLTAEQTLVLRQRLLFLSVPVMELHCISQVLAEFMENYPTFQKHHLFTVTHHRSHAVVFHIPFLSDSLSVH